MAFKVGRRKDEERRSPGSRIPMNYYRSAGPEPAASPFVKKIKKTGKARKFVVRTIDIVVLIVLLYGLGYSLLVKSTPKVMANDTTYHSIADYTAAAAKDLGAFKNRNKISLDEQGIVTSLEKQFPEIDSATIELPLFSETAIIHLSIAKPSFFLSNNGANYVIDSQGVATSTSKNLPQIKNLTTLSDQSGFGAAVGQQLLSAQSVSFINEVLAQTARAKVPVSTLILPQAAEELDLRTTDRPYYVKFFLAGDPTLQSGQFLAARHDFDQTGKQPSTYLDVRVPGKIFFK